MAKNIHVTHSNNKWRVISEGSSRAGNICKTKAEAVEIARNRAINNHTELIIHGLKGPIQSRNSYGNDPFPPRG